MDPVGQLDAVLRERCSEAVVHGAVIGRAFVLDDAHLGGRAGEEALRRQVVDKGA